MINVLELLEGAAILCVLATLFCAWRARGSVRSWAVAAAAFTIASAGLELYLGM